MQDSATPTKAWAKLSSHDELGDALEWRLAFSMLTTLIEMAKYGDETGGEFALDNFKTVYIKATQISYVS